MINVGIDTDILHSSLTGVGNYCFHTLSALLHDNSGDHSDHSSDLAFTAFSGLGWRSFSISDLDRIAALHRKHSKSASIPATSLQKARLAARTHVANSDLTRRMLRRIATLPFRSFASKGRLDLYHAFKYLPIAEIDVPVLPVIYDLSFVRFPEAHPRYRLAALERLPSIAARAPFVHTISEFSRREIADVYGYPPERIIVAPPAASDVFRPLGAAATQAAIARFDLALHRYFLAVGTLEPRKNLKTLISAYARLTWAERNAAPLVIVGSPGWGNLDLPKETDALIADGSLRFLGAVTDDELRGLYEGAVALLYPSIYEGFGMPVVEALACGTQVAHSAGTSMDEITAGLSTLRTHATNVDGWHTILQELGGAPERVSEDRDERIVQARHFSWDASAAKVKAVYRRIAA